MSTLKIIQRTQNILYKIMSKPLKVFLIYCIYMYNKRDKSSATNKIITQYAKKIRRKI